MDRANGIAGRARLGEDGFALATVLLALVALTVLATAGFLYSRTDYRINRNHIASVRAFYVADAARSQYLGSAAMDTIPVTFTYADGSADVWGEPLIDVNDRATLYRLTSRGTHGAPGGTGPSSRTVRSVVMWTAADFSLNAAITAPAGLNKNGASGSVDGHDAATPADCPSGGSQDVAGLELPPGTFNQNGGGGGKGKGKGGGGGASGFDGVPPIDSTKTAGQLLTALGIDWQGLLDGSYSQADFIVSVDGYPNFGTQVGPNEWPLILVDQSSYSFNPPQSGRGTLVIQGDATFNGSFSWDGIILIGGELTSNGNQTIRGSVVTGLNLLLGQTPNATNVGNGTWDYQYHSCNVLAALKGIGYTVEEPGTWSEDF